MITPPYPQTLTDAFLAALQHMLDANRQDNTKHRRVREWFEENFGVAGRASLVTESKQAGNRVVEQFKHLDPHVVFVCFDDEVLEKVREHAAAKWYPGLKTLLLVNKNLDAEELMYNGQSKVLDYYRAIFAGVPEHQYASPIAAAGTPSTAGAAASSTTGVDWNTAFMSVSPCGLVGLEQPMIQALSALRAGKHVIFLGPPGTGKTELARCICESLKVPHDLATATSEWTTFDTIGGYFTTPGGAAGALDFVPGIVTNAIDKNRWLVVDELNRADIDKALGELFTVFAGAPVSLPYKKVDGGDLKQVFLGFDDGSDVPTDSFAYLIQPDWRIIGTMNTFDKASLYQLSYAFMRRFAFVNVDVPKQADFAALISASAADLDVSASSLGDPDKATVLLINVFAAPAGTGLDALQLRVGPAIFLDVVTYVRARLASWSPTLLLRLIVAEALVMYLFPQFEGREQDHEHILAAIVQALNLDDSGRDDLSSKLADWTGYRKVLAE